MTTVKQMLVFKQTPESMYYQEKSSIRVKCWNLRYDKTSLFI
jgi:hypothetical protein